MKDGEGSEMETPEWRAEYNLGRRYQASYNIAPTDITPVIVSAAHFSDAEDQECARVVTPMMWGMIPFGTRVTIGGMALPPTIAVWNT